MANPGGLNQGHQLTRYLGLSQVTSSIISTHSPNSPCRAGCSQLLRYQASAQFIQELLRPYADPSLGPVLQLGCGDAPVPEQLQLAGAGGLRPLGVEDGEIWWFIGWLGGLIHEPLLV